MESRISITAAELLEALAKARGTEEDGFLTSHVEQALGISRPTAQRRIRALLHAGLIIPDKVRFVDIQGRYTSSLGYRWVTK